MGQGSVTQVGQLSSDTYEWSRRMVLFLVSMADCTCRVGAGVAVAEVLRESKTLALPSCHVSAALLLYLKTKTAVKIHGLL
jgi:hypothetical protein